MRGLIFCTVSALVFGGFCGCEQNKSGTPLPVCPVWFTDLGNQDLLKDLEGRRIVVRTPLVVRFVDSTQTNGVNGQAISYDIYSLKSLEDLVVLRAQGPQKTSLNDYSSRIMDGTYFVCGTIKKVDAEYQLMDLVCSTSPYREIDAIELRTYDPNPKASQPNLSWPKRFEGPELRTGSVAQTLVGQTIEFPADVVRSPLGKPLSPENKYVYDLKTQTGEVLLTGESIEPIPDGAWWVRGVLQQGPHGYYLTSATRVEQVIREPIKAPWKK